MRFVLILNVVCVNSTQGSYLCIKYLFAIRASAPHHHSIFLIYVQRLSFSHGGILRRLRCRPRVEGFKVRHLNPLIDIAASHCAACPKSHVYGQVSAQFRGAAESGPWPDRFARVIGQAVEISLSSSLTQVQPLAYLRPGQPFRAQLSHLCSVYLSARSSKLLPLARALRRPARTRSRIRSRSSCATADTIVNNACPSGEVVSMFS